LILFRFVAVGLLPRLRLLRCSDCWILRSITFRCLVRLLHVRFVCSVSFHFAFALLRCCYVCSFVTLLLLGAFVTLLFSLFVVVVVLLRCTLFVVVVFLIVPFSPLFYVVRCCSV
jgi:hypothetical protein